MNQVSLICANRIIQGKCTEIAVQTSDLFLTFFLSELSWDRQPWQPQRRSKPISETRNGQLGRNLIRGRTASEEMLSNTAWPP